MPSTSPPAVAWPGWPAPAARPAPTTTTCSPATAGTCSPPRSRPRARSACASTRPAARWTWARAHGGLPPDHVVEDLDAVLLATEAAIDRWHDPSPGSMLRVAVAPCSPFSVTADLLREAAALARRRDVLLHTHLAETLDEEKFCRERFGCSPVDYMESLGWLGADVWFAHAVHLDDDAVMKIGATGTGVAHCPSSNGRLGSGIARARDLRDAGARVGLGVDGAASNESASMLEEVAQRAAVRPGHRRPAGALGPRRPRDGHARRRRGARAGRPTSARWSPASWPTSRSGGSTRSRTPTSPTRSPPWCSASRPPLELLLVDGRTVVERRPRRHRRRARPGPRGRVGPPLPALLDPVTTMTDISTTAPTTSPTRPAVAPPTTGRQPAAEASATARCAPTATSR